MTCAYYEYDIPAEPRYSIFSAPAIYLRRDALVVSGKEHQVRCYAGYYMHYIMMVCCNYLRWRRRRLRRCSSIFG